MWNMVSSGIVYEANWLCPYKWITIKENKQVWYNSSLKSIAVERDKLFQAFIKSKRKKPWLYQLAFEKRKEHNRAVKKCKEDFFKSCLKLNSENCKTFWKNVNDLIGTTVQPSIGRVFEYNTTYLCSESESIDVINKFFAGVAERLLEQLDRSSVQVYSSNLDEKTELVFEEFTPITVNIFLEIIATFSYTKSSGYEDLNSKLLLDTMKCIPQIFVYICNCSFNTGVFPTNCKVARVTIIPKGGDLRYLDNLRPISILPILGRILERHAKS